MLPIRDENPKPAGYKPMMTIALIAANVIIFFVEVAITGQFFEFNNNRAVRFSLIGGQFLPVSLAIES